MARRKSNICFLVWLGGLSLAVVLAILAWMWLAHNEKITPADNKESVGDLEADVDSPTTKHEDKLQQDETSGKAEDRKSSEKSATKRLELSGNQNSNALEQDTSRGRRHRSSAHRSSPPYRSQSAREEHGRRAGR